MKKFNGTFCTKSPLKCNPFRILNALYECFKIYVSCLQVEYLPTNLVICYRTVNHVKIMKHIC